MNIKCAFCSTPITSLDIDTKAAIREIGNKLSQHLITSHREHITKLQKTTSNSIMAITWYILFSQAAKVPEDETKIIEAIEEVRAGIAATIGVEIIGNEDECEIVDVEEEEKVEETNTN